MTGITGFETSNNEYIYIYIRWTSNPETNTETNTETFIMLDKIITCLHRIGAIYDRYEGIRPINKIADGTDRDRGIFRYNKQIGIKDDKIKLISDGMCGTMEDLQNFIDSMLSGN